MAQTNTFVTGDSDPEYVVRVRKPSYRWLWISLILLLPLLLLLRFGKDVAIIAYDNQSENNLPGVEVKFTYVDYALIKTNPVRFFASDTINLATETNGEGEATFTNVTYTLFSILFHRGAETEITAAKGCLFSDTLAPLFRHLRAPLPYRIPLGKGRLDVVFKVLDSDDNQPLSNARVEVDVDGSIKELLTDSDGYVNVAGLDVCGNINLNAQMEGYAGDTIISDMETVLRNENNRTLHLVPGRGVVSFTVKDIDNQQPIANALASLIINGDTVICSTNTNGVGKGSFEDIYKKYHFEIGLRKMCYYDTLTREFKMTEFEQLSDAERTFFMRPQKNTLKFRNIDSLTGKPVSGVKNHVFVNGGDMGTLVSNRLGCFTIGNLNDNDVLEIQSSHVSYKLKVVNRKGKDVSGNNQHSRDILMERSGFVIGKPNPSRHCGVHFSGTMLADEKVGTHISTIYVPDDFGEYVGDGRYPSNKVAFPKAVKYTFDAIAVDAGTNLIIYEKPDFQGKVLLDVHGPCLINNVKFQNDSRIKDFQTKTFSPELEANYPPSCRKWSDSDMNAWDFGSSIITCD